jgi:hypothetical protein
MYPRPLEPVVLDQALDREVNLADHHALVIAFEHFAHLRHDFMDLRAIGAVALQELAVLRIPGPIAGIRRVVAELVVLDEMPQDVNPESIDTAIEPEADHVVHRFAHFTVPPVQVRLRFQEGVEIVLPGALVPFPRAAAEDGKPVVRRAAIGFGIAPDVPVPARVIARRAAFDEPRMLVRSMIGNEIQNHFEFAPVRFLHQQVEIGERAERRRDVAIVGDVVTEIRHGGRIDRRDPQRAHPQPREVIEALADTVQVAFAVAVTVVERQGIDLVNDPVLPPQIGSLRSPGRILCSHFRALPVRCGSSKRSAVRGRRAYQRIFLSSSLA